MALTYMYEDTFSKKWTRGPTYGGSLVENCIQGLCRDLMGEALLRAKAAKLPVVLHVHDEIVCEVPEGKNYTAQMLENSMNEVPEWASGFPIDSKGFATLRYRKD
jgi:DNA polymerase